MAAKKGTKPGFPLRWGWMAVLAGAALAALETRELITLVGWERTLPFARALLVGAIATAAMTLAALLLIVALVVIPRTRKWGLALGIAWGAIVTASSLWVAVGPYVKNLWQELLFRAHLTSVLVQYEAVRSPQRRLTDWIAGLGALLVASSAKGFADRPRDRLDLGIIMMSIFYAAFYYLAIAIVARLVTPH
ncbi:MAG TPA: hypothetical protein VNJ12_07245 [Candidatus Dormibacteraeota bacterium]|nr:hypothetical protein [Candidatus Dormibacteraeota bacterium]